MTARHANELLYDSEAALRLVDTAIEDIRDTHPGAAEALHAGNLRDLLQTAGPLGLLGISRVLARGYGEIVGVLQSVRESRDVLSRTASDRLLNTHRTLREATSATEMAAPSILHGLDRAVALVDQIDVKAAEGDAAAGAVLRNTLREELSSLMGRLQLQDITTQQLSYASSVLSETEARLAELASILGPTSLGAAGAGVNDPTRTGSH